MICSDLFGNFYISVVHPGFGDMANRFVPEKVKSFAKKEWVCIQGGQHHTVALDSSGKPFENSD